jgi:hypothetical protein
MSQPWTLRTISFQPAVQKYGSQVQREQQFSAKRLGPKKDHTADQPFEGNLNPYRSEVMLSV